MKKGIILILTSYILLFSNTVYANSNNILRVAGDRYYPPYEYLDEDGSYKGFNVDLSTALGIEMKRDVKFIPMEWLAAHAALLNDEVDIIQGMNFNSQRKEIYDFSTPYVLNASIVFSKNENEQIMELGDLKGKIVAVQRSDFTSYILAEQGGIEIKFVPDLQIAFKELIEDKVDAVFGNKLTGIYIINKLNLEELIIPIGDDINQMDYGIAVKKGNEQLLKEVNEALLNLKKNGTYSKIYEKWFGEYEDRTEDQRKIISSIFLIATFSIVYSIAVHIWNKSLKSQVSKRTAELDKANQEIIQSRNLVIENNNFKEQIMDSLAIGLITFNRSGQITAFNTKATQIFSFNKEEVLNKSFQEVGLSKYFNTEHIDVCREFGKSVVVNTTVFQIGDSKYNYNYLISPLKTIDNKDSVGGVITFRDITDESEMRARLEEQSKMKSLGRVVAGIAHEIRNPLTSIKTYLDMLPEKYEDKRFRDKMLSQAPKEINRLNSLLKDLIDYSKPPKAVIEVFFLEDVINDAINIAENSCTNKDIVIRFNMDQRIILLNEKDKLKQVLINVLLNSVESILANGNIDIVAYGDNEYAHISIIDNGKGIDEDSKDKIFEPFYTTKGNGTGLGLALCYQYLNEMQGDISIYNNETQGAVTNISVKLNRGDLMYGKDTNNR